MSNTYGVTQLKTPASQTQKHAQKGSGAVLILPPRHTALCFPPLKVLLPHPTPQQGLLLRAQALLPAEKDGTGSSWLTGMRASGGCQGRRLQKGAKKLGSELGTVLPLSSRISRTEGSVSGRPLLDAAVLRAQLGTRREGKDASVSKTHRLKRCSSRAAHHSLTVYTHTRIIRAVTVN